MRAIAVDDEPFALKSLTGKLREVPRIAQVEAFESPHKAMEWITDHMVDIAFLDIDMRGMNGITLAKEIKAIQPRCAVIFVTGYPEYALDAFGVYAVGYLLKPLKVDHILKTVENICPTSVRTASTRRLRVQCFGNFEVFEGDKIMNFRYKKTKELLAYLVDRRGAAVELAELRAVLWEDRADNLSLRSQLRNSISDLTSSLRGANLECVLRKRRNSLAINVAMLECDYYNFLQCKQGAMITYKGEYMRQYSWAEMTLGGLEQTRTEGIEADEN